MDITELGKCEKYRMKSMPFTMVLSGGWVIVDHYTEIGLHLGSWIDYYGWYEG